MEKYEINVKIILSGLWTAVMLCFAYADILAHMRSDIIEGILAGELGGIQLTQEALLGSAALMVIPILMIFLSLTVKDKINRWLNIVLGAVYTVVNLATMLMTGGGLGYFYVFAIVEVVFSAMIVWYAWKWK